MGWYYFAAVAAFLTAELVPLRGTHTVLAAKRGNPRLAIYLKDLTVTPVYPGVCLYRVVVYNNGAYNTINSITI